MDDLYTEQKTTAGGFATFLWIIVGVYVFATTDSTSFLSWQAIVYFIPGIFAAAIVIGGGAYLLKRIVAQIFILVFSNFSSLVIFTVESIGLLIDITQIIVVYFIGKYVIMSILFSNL